MTFAAAQAAPAEVPLIAMSWGSDLLRGAELGSLSADVASQALGRCALLFSDCGAVATKARQLGFEGEVSQFPWGVSIEQFHPSGERWDGAPTGCGPVILTTRNWEAIYDVQTVARAFDRLWRNGTRAQLVIAGAGSLESKLREILADASEAGVVTWLGRTPYSELPSVYRAADIYVSTSLSDGSSVSLLEAMATGLFPVTSDIPGNREWVGDPLPGRVFPPGDVDRLAEVLLEVIELSEEQKASIRGAVRVRAERDADWSVNRLRIVEAYKQVVGRS